MAYIKRYKYQTGISIRKLAHPLDFRSRPAARKVINCAWLPCKDAIQEPGALRHGGIPFSKIGFGILEKGTEGLRFC